MLISWLILDHALYLINCNNSFKVSGDSKIFLILYFLRSILLDYTVGDKKMTFCSVLPYRGTAVTLCTRVETNGRRLTWRKMQSTISIVTSTKMTPQVPKKAIRSITLSKQSHLEAIRVNWQREIDRSSIPDFKPSRASIAQSQNSLKIEERQ